MTVRAPRCPGCDDHPFLVAAEMGFCANTSCQVLTWDLTADPAQFKARAKVIDACVRSDVARGDVITSSKNVDP